MAVEYVNLHQYANNLKGHSHNIFLSNFMVRSQSIHFAEAFQYISSNSECSRVEFNKSESSFSWVYPHSLCYATWPICGWKGVSCRHNHNIEGNRQFCLLAYFTTRGHWYRMTSSMKAHKREDNRHHLRTHSGDTWGMQSS